MATRRATHRDLIAAEVMLRQPKETTVTDATTKTCPGVKAANPPILPHVAPADQATFGRNAARPDGLGRVCKVCWAVYTQVLKAAKAGAAPVTGATVNAGLGATIERIARQEAATIGNYDDDTKRLAALPGWSTEVIDTTRYAVPVEPDAVGTDDGQAALATWKKARDAARKRSERAAAKAAKAVTA